MRIGSASIHALVPFVGVLAFAFAAGLANAQDQSPPFKLWEGSANGKPVPLWEANFGSAYVPVSRDLPLADFQVEMTTQIKKQGLVPNGDSFALLFKLNGVNSIAELKKKTAIVSPIFDFKSIDQPVWMTTDPFVKKSLFESVSSLEAYQQTIVNLPGVDKSDLVQFKSSTENFSYIASVASSGSLPLSGNLLSKIGGEAMLASAIAGKWKSGEAPTPSDRYMLSTFQKDSSFILASVSKEKSPGGGDFGNGETMVTVNLTKNHGTVPALGYRVLAAPPFLMSDPTALSILTNPAEGSLPWATYCYYAVDAQTGVRVSDAVVLSAQSLYDLPQKQVDLAFIGPQTTDPSCTPSL